MADKLSEQIRYEAALLEGEFPPLADRLRDIARDVGKLGAEVARLQDLWETLQRIFPTEARLTEQAVEARVALATALAAAEEDKP